MLRRRHLAAVVAGNALEFYDFIIYSFFALQIGRTFFPSDNPLSSLLLSLATFGAGFLTRPVGALIIGRYADRAGRKPAMMLSFLLMGIAIAGIAFTPSYHAIGVAAPVLVVGWRLLQGFAMGGEAGPIVAFLVEAAPREQRGLYGSLLIATSGFAVFVAGLVGLGLSSALSAQGLDDWGWRCAFLLGAAVVPIGLAIRRSLPETLRAAEQESLAEPIERSRHARAILLCLVLLSASTAMTYVRAYLQTYSVGNLGISSNVGFTSTMINGVGTVVFFMLGGWLSDRYGRKPVMIAFTLLLIMCALPCFIALVHFRTPAVLYATMALLTAVTGLGQGPLMAAIIESLPPRVRAGAVGTLYAVAVAVFGGSTQFAIAWLIGYTGSLLVPAWYLSAAALIGVAAMFMIRETAPRTVSGMIKTTIKPEEVFP